MGSFLSCSPHHIFCTELGAHGSARLTGQLWGATCLYLPSAETIGFRATLVAHACMTDTVPSGYFNLTSYLMPRESTAKHLFRADSWERGRGGLPGGGCGKSPAVQLQGMWPEQMNPGSHTSDTWLSSCSQQLRVLPSSSVDPLNKQVPASCENSEVSF